MTSERPIAERMLKMDGRVHPARWAAHGPADMQRLACERPVVSGAEWTGPGNYPWQVDEETLLIVSVFVVIEPARNVPPMWVAMVSAKAREGAKAYHVKMAGDLRKLGVQKALEVLNGVGDESCSRLQYTTNPSGVTLERPMKDEEQERLAEPFRTGSTSNLQEAVAALKKPPALRIVPKAENGKQ